MESVQKYFDKLDTIRKCDQDIIYVNFDEVLSQYTFQFKGEKNVDLINNNKSKVRTTVGACITSEGEFLPPLVVSIYKQENKKVKKNPLKAMQKREYPRKYEGLRNQIRPFVLRFTPSGFNNEKLMIEWITKFLLPYAKTKAEEGSRTVFLLDAASFHISSNVKSLLKENNIDLAKVPAGCTDFLQPLDVCINKPLKDKVRQQYVKWLEENYGREESFMKAGYLKAPDPEIFLGWVIQAMSLIERNIKVNSSQVCGVAWGMHENVNLNQKLLKSFDDLVIMVSLLLIFPLLRFLPPP